MAIVSDMFNGAEIGQCDSDGYLSTKVSHDLFASFISNNENSRYWRRPLGVAQALLRRVADEGYGSHRRSRSTLPCVGVPSSSIKTPQHKTPVHQW